MAGDIRPTTTDTAVTLGTNTTAGPVPGTTSERRHTRRQTVTVLRTEARLFLREPAMLFWVVAFPALLLTVLGLVPDFREHQDSLGGRRTIDLYVPITVLLALIMAGIQAMPPVLTGYRERGILRRMSTTPIRPAALLTAQIALHALAALVSVLLVLTIGRVAFQVPLPHQVGGFVVAVVLAAVVALCLGALICSLTPNTKVANATSTALFFPMMFTAGLWVPVESMPHTLQRIVQATPFGAVARALDQAAAGVWPAWSHLGVGVLWAAVVLAVAARWFRWQ